MEGFIRDSITCKKMTDNMQKHIGHEHWNNNNLVYWSAVAQTLKL